MRMFHRENDVAKLARNREALFDLHAQSLEALERYTGIAYPFGKFDFVLVPAFQFGAMEHAGNIAYNAESMLLDEAATQEQLLARAHMIAQRLPTCGSATWSRCAGSTMSGPRKSSPTSSRTRSSARYSRRCGRTCSSFWRTTERIRGGPVAGANPIRQSLANLE